MKRPPLRILLVDDHRLFSNGLRLILERTPGLVVVGEAADSSAALELAASGRPDVVLTDIHLTNDDGIELAGRITAVCPEAKIVFLSGDADFALVRRALKAGGHGYLLKASAAHDVLRAIEAARSGGMYLSPEVALALVEVHRQCNAEAAPAAGPSLSDREAEVLRLIAEGLRNKEIAQHLKVGAKSVETYRRRLLIKLGYTSTAELVRHAVREGLIKP